MNDESYNLGLERAKSQDYTAAIAQFTLAIANNPYFTSAYIHRGLAYYDSGAILQAVYDYTEALKIDESSMEAYYCRALARVALKNLPGALEDVDKAIRLNANYAPAYNLRGIIHRKQSCILEAIANFKKAAELYLKEKNAAQCQQCLDNIKQLQPPTTISPEVPSIPLPIISTEEYFIQLLQKAENGKTREAIADIDWILKADPQDAQAYCYRGVVKCKMGNYREAIADFNQSLNLKFTDALVYRNRGKARFMIADYQGALNDFHKTIEIQPEDPLVYVARGNAYQKMGKYLDAMQDYEKALQLDPNYASAYYNRGLTYTLLEEMGNAILDYQKAASIYSEKEDWDNYQQVLNSLQKIHTSTPEIHQQKYEILRQRLLRKVGGHWEIAQRLIQQQEYNYPGMSQEWYLQRVIEEIESDRS